MPTAPANLYFELLNEPNNQLTPGLWNNYLARGPGCGPRYQPPSVPSSLALPNGGGLGALDELVLPDDPNLIVTVHYYEPFHFTHQGAEWSPGSDAWLGTTWTGTGRRRTGAVISDLDRAARWAQRHGVPLFLGRVRRLQPRRYGFPAPAGPHLWPARPSAVAWPGPTGSSAPDLASMIPRPAPGASPC